MPPDNTDEVLNRNSSELLLLMNPDAMVCGMCNKIFYKELNAEIVVQSGVPPWAATCFDCLLCIKAMSQPLLAKKDTLNFLVKSNTSLEKIEKVFGDIYKVSLVSADLSFEKIAPNE